MIRFNNYNINSLLNLILKRKFDKDLSFGGRKIKVCSPIVFYLLRENS